jgi:DNA-binding GntR family transcriptional regulator
LQVGPSLRIVCGRYGTANLPDKHSEALTALHAGNAGNAAEAIADDIRQGMGQVGLTLST